MGGFLRRVGATFGRTNVARITSILLTLQLALFPYASALAQSSVVATPLPNAKQTFVDQNGKPYSGGKVYNYVPNTSTPKTTWSDTGETTPNSNPVVLDSAGRGVIFGQGNYRQVLKDSAGNTIWDSFTTAVGSSDPSGSSSTDTAPVGAIMSWAGFSIPTNWLLAYGQTVNRADYPGLLTALTITNASTSCTAGSATLSGLADTSQMPIGAKIEASCLPTGTTISAKPSATTLTVSANATATGTFSSTVFPWGNGDGTLTFNLPDLRGRVFAGADAMGGTAANRLTSTYFGSSAASPAVAGGSQSHTLTAAESAALNYTANTSIPSSALAITGTQQFAALGGTTPNMALTGVANITATTTISSNAGGQAHSIIQPTLTVNYIIKALPNTSGAGGVVSIGGMFGDITCGAFVTCENNTISLGSAPTATLNHGQMYVGDASNTPQGTFSPTLGLPGSNAGSLGLTSGTQAGTATIKNPSATADYNFNLPADAGSVGSLLTSGGGGSQPSVWQSLSNLFNTTFCNTVGYMIARTTGGWTCSRDIPLNVVWFGADPTGVASSVLAFNTAYAACSFRCQIFFPPGAFLFDSANSITNNSVKLDVAGSGSRATILTTPANTDITFFGVTASGTHFRNIGFQQDFPSGWTIAATANAAVGTNVLQFASMPSWIAVGSGVVDATLHAGATKYSIPNSTTVTAIDSVAHTITLSANIVDDGNGSGVISGDGIIIAPASTHAAILLNNDIAATSALDDLLVESCYFGNLLGYGVELSGGSSTSSTSAGSAIGSFTMTFSAVPSWVTIGMTVIDMTAHSGATTTATQSGTLVTAKTATTITLSKAIQNDGAGNGVLTGDQIVISNLPQGYGIQNAKILSSTFQNIKRGGMDFFKGIRDSTASGNFLYENSFAISLDDATHGDQITAGATSNPNHRLVFNANIYNQNGTPFVGSGEAAGFGMSGSTDILVSNSTFYLDGHGPWSDGTNSLNDIGINNGQDAFNRSARIKLLGNVHWASAGNAIDMFGPQDVSITNSSFLDWLFQPGPVTGAAAAITINDDSVNASWGTDGLIVGNNIFRLGATVTPDWALTAVEFGSATNSTNVRVSGNLYNGGVLHFANTNNEFTGAANSNRNVQLDDNPRFSRVSLANNSAAQVFLSEFTTGTAEIACSNVSFASHAWFQVQPTGSLFERWGWTNTDVGTSASPPTGTSGTAGKVTLFLVTGTPLGRAYLENRSGAQIACNIMMHGAN